MDFKLVSDYKPSGDQGQAIENLLHGLEQNMHTQVLLGVTGSGKTFTMANVIEKIKRPVLVVTHNKTLAGQLYQEFRDFFPHNAVCYFVSYYDYYQPEAYIPHTDTYIEKETDINDEIDKLRLAATTNLLTRQDVIVVASVSCIYNLGSPVEYGRWILRLAEGMKVDRNDILHRLNDLQYSRADYDFHRGTYRIRGEMIDIFPAYDDAVIRIEFDGLIIRTITYLDPLTGKLIADPQVGKDTATAIDYEPQSKAVTIYPAKHYMMDPKTQQEALAEIEKDMAKRVKDFESGGKILEAHRIKQKVTYDLEMIRELGYVNGIENYSRYFDGRQPGGAPYTLIDYFNYNPFKETFNNLQVTIDKTVNQGNQEKKKSNDSMASNVNGQMSNVRDWLCIIDESHITLPQIRGMYNGDQARKKTLIDFGFRLPSALDNRPLRFDEFLRRLSSTVCASATPNQWEISRAHEAASGITPPNPLFEKEGGNSLPFAKGEERRGSQNYTGVAQQIIRPTGLLDPEIEVRPADRQVANLLPEIRARVEQHERVLVTTLTKRMAEELSTYLEEQGIKVHYLHSEVDTLERMDILQSLRLGEYDVIVGINLLREGLDLPEVSLVAILDADKEGFLRSETSLIQTMGRAARHVNGKVIMYADKITDSMRRAIDEVERRRKIQAEYNQTHGINPESIQKPVRERMVEAVAEDDRVTYEVGRGRKKSKRSIDDEELTQLLISDPDNLTPEQRKQFTRVLKQYMNQAAKNLNFELAAKLRDKLKEIG